MIMYQTMNAITPMELLDRFFYNWPKNDPKPPAAWRPILEEIEGKEECCGLEIQLAVAGFKEEDLKVYQQGRKLIVEGDNTQRAEVDQKWKSQFKKEVSLQEKLDLDNSEVKLFDGLLSIKIPLFKSLREKKYLLGKKE